MVTGLGRNMIGLLKRAFLIQLRLCCCFRPLERNRLSKSDGKIEMLIKNQSLKHRDDFLTSCFS